MATFVAGSGGCETEKVSFKADRVVVFIRSSETILSRYQTDL
jgi:hypothetical protein